MSGRHWALAAVHRSRRALHPGAARRHHPQLVQQRRVQRVPAPGLFDPLVCQSCGTVRFLCRRPAQRRARPACDRPRPDPRHAHRLCADALPGSRAPALFSAFVLAPIVLPKIVLGVALFMFFVRLGVADHYSSLLITHTLVTFPFVVAVLSAALRQFRLVARGGRARPRRRGAHHLLPRPAAQISHQRHRLRDLRFRDLLRPGRDHALPGASRPEDAADRDVPLPAEMAGSDHRCALGRADRLRRALVAGLGLALRNRQQALGLLSRTKEITP